MTERIFEGTLAQALTSGLIQPGDRLLLRAGTYPAGDLVASISGTEANPIVITNYPDEAVLIQPASGYRGLLVQGSYLTFVGDISFDGGAVTSDCIKITDGAHGIILENLTLYDAPMNGVLITGAETQAILRNVTSHGHGTSKGDHGVYVGDGVVTIEGGEFYNNRGHGIHVYGGHSHTTVKNTYCHNNTNVGIGVYSDEALIYNNVCRENGESGLRIRYDALDIQAYFNTLVDNPNNIDVRSIYQTIARPKVKNNVCIGGAIGIYVQTSNPDMPEASIELYNNLTYGGLTHTILIDEIDVEAVAQADNLAVAFSPVTDNGAIYTPGIGNPAIGAGVALDGIATDYGGNVRANPPTIGAWE